MMILIWCDMGNNWYGYLVGWFWLLFVDFSGWWVGGLGGWGVERFILYLVFFLLFLE
jgi:hypothetical protein